MNFSINQIYTMKLNSGEELIGKVITVSGNELTITSPVSVAPGPQGMGLMPSLFTADPDSSVTLNTSSIIMYGPTEDSIKDKYIEATSGIKLPSKKIVMG